MAVRGSLAAVPLAWLLTAVPLGVQIQALKYGPRTAWIVALLVLAALVVAHVKPRWGLAVVIGLAGGAHLADGVLRGRTLVVIVALPLAWALVTGAVRWRRSGLVDRRVRAAAAPLVVADALLLVGNGLTLPSIAIAVALATIALIEGIRPAESPEARPGLAEASSKRPGPGAGRLARVQRLAAANQRLLDRIGAPLGRVTGAIAMVPAALVACLAWAAHRVVGHDPLDPPTPQASRWVERTSPDPDPQRLFPGGQVADPRGPSHTLRRLAAGGLTLALIAALAGAATMAVDATSDDAAGGDTDAAAADAPCSSGPDEAMDGQPGWPQVGCDTTEFSARGRFDAVTTYSFRDFSSETVNSSGGVRRTWTPPACDCPRVRVWWLGGSAAWGWYQRDEFTIPSELAKAAWADGVALDVVNYAMPGWVLGQEARKFGELSTLEPVPDLVVYYDLGNDLNRQRDRNAEGRGADESETSFTESEVDNVLANGPFSFGMEMERRETSWPRGEVVDDDDVARHAMNRYRRGHELARTLGLAVGVQPVFVWQPLAPSAPPSASNDDAVSKEDRAVWNRMLDVADRMRPDDVIDLTDSLDDVGRPVFKDLWHTNEHAAAVVAGQLWDELRPRITPAVGP